MSRIVFVPLTDEMVFERPEMIAGPITTYRPAMPKRSSRPATPKESVTDSTAYLRGDLVNGFDVVYVKASPTLPSKARK